MSAQELEPPQTVLVNLINLYNQGQFAEAANDAAHLIDKFPQSALLYNIHGASNAGLGRLDFAIKSYKKAKNLKPHYAEVYYNMGMALKKKGDLEAAIDSLQKAIKIRPDFADAYKNMGIVFADKGDLDAAIESYKRAIKVNPYYADVYRNMGVVYKYKGDLTSSINCYEQAIKLNSNCSKVHINMGNLLRDGGQIEMAKKSYEQAIQIKKDCPEAHYNKSITYLLNGEFDLGFELYEYRSKIEQKVVRPARAEFSWNGEKDLKGKNFLVYEEQGIGDIIQFCRYLPLLEDLGANVSFKVAKKLHPLLKTLGDNINLIHQTPNDNVINFEAPLLSLPHLFKTNKNNIPAKTEYLQSDPALFERWKLRFTDGKFNIGICWQGSNTKIDIGRSFPLALFEDMARNPRVRLISLHKGSGELQIEQIGFGITTLGPGFDTSADAFADTAAVMMNCDLIITSDTAIAHLAGALGCKTWIALKFIPDWRWLLGTSVSLWYPTATLYRQESLNDWKDVFTRMGRDLRGMIEHN